MQKVRLADIAQKLGVSTVTVHNALCGRKGVSEALRERILQAASEMGYEAPAGGVKKKDAQNAWNIGALIAENFLAQYETYYWKLYQEFAKLAVEKNCNTVVDVLKKEAERRTLEIPQAFLETEPDAIAVIGEIDIRYIRMLKSRMQVPMVYIDFYNHEIADDAVVADNFYGMCQMTELLFECGLERLAFVGSVDASASIMDRYLGFMRAMIARHRTVPPEWVICDRDEMGKLGVELPKHMPQGFVCNCDLAAEMVIDKLEAAGYRAPEDISVVGFDNFVLKGCRERGITTYEIDRKAMVKTALDKLIKQLRTPGRKQSCQIISGQIRWKNSVRKI